MKLNEYLLKEKFLEILNESITFEEGAFWASEMMAKNEIGELEYDSSDDISKLFSALTFLAGLSTEISPRTYLYTIEDVKIEYDQLFSRS
ncbi:putative uncharacterized protein [Waddlia chondrophila 2032/99]|uniref:Uncharacterized protein n=2 Tax=Waddlia chondrophila TaxID=71667 RepID=D6YTU1_WADCW|nr:hypothetical protein [Waddlia chondrophila]ADI37552.1 hypothetical protein wcw_0177 [Waddlia chondrophila WSU 86-1044]CCB91783.1 putative uncharacterized protein [Waddlia chondrophila 2032/99]